MSKTIVKRAIKRVWDPDRQCFIKPPPTEPAQGHTPGPNLCQNQASKLPGEQCADTSKSIEKNTVRKSEHFTQQAKNANLPGTHSDAIRQKGKQEQNCGTQFGAARSSNQRPVQSAGKPEQYTATIKTIQDLLTLNGSAQSATVRLTESTKRLIAAAPDLLSACKALHDHIDNDLAGYWTECTSNIMQMTEAVIAKATGKAQ